MNVSTTRLWILGLTLLGSLVIVATYRDYGISWDEAVQSQLGEGAVRYFASGGEDRSINEFHHNRFYGPLFEFATALLYSAGSTDPAGSTNSAISTGSAVSTGSRAKYEIRHLATAVTGLLALLGVFRIASLAPLRLGAVYAWLALATMPRFYGHAFVNSKDVPFACCFVWSLYALIGVNRDPRSWRRVLLAGLALGLTLGIRPGGLPLMLLLYVCLLAYAVWSRAEVRAAEGTRLALTSVAIWSIAWLGMISLWPWAHEAPLSNPIAAIRAAASFPDTFPVLFDGRVTMSDALPRSYLVRYLAITTPPLTLLLSMVGIVASVRWQRRGRSTPQALLAFALQLWLFAPLAVIAIARPNVYDGIRHVLFTLPALAIFAGWGAATLVDSIAKPARQNAALAVLGLVLALPALHLVRLHPYQMTYFNFLVGGVEGATGRFETDYWLLSYREAIEWLNDRAREREDGTLRVLVAVDDHAYDCAARFAAPGVHIEQQPEEESPPRLPSGYDYFVGTTRYGLHRHFSEAPIVHRVGRAGGVFSVIRGH